MKTNFRFRYVAGWKGGLFLALLLFSLSSACPTVAQQSSQSDDPSSQPQPVRQNLQTPRENALPTAPSASRPSANSMSFDERLRHYRHSLVSHYSNLGTPFGSAIGQWEDEVAASGAAACMPPPKHSHLELRMAPAYQRSHASRAFTVQQHFPTSGIRTPEQPLDMFCAVDRQH